MGKMIPTRIARLREEMKKRNISIYVIPTSDFHESEYVGEYFKARKFMTGFTGSAGTAVITMEEAGLWTDGRYFVQAAEQLKDSTVTLYKMGEPGVPTVDEYIMDTLKNGETLGFDGRVVNSQWGKKLEKIAEEKQANLYVDEDLVDFVWEDRPAMSCEPVMILKEEYSGKSTAEKIADVRKVMKEKHADIHLISSLYDIAWLLNVRGGDISHVPVVLSHLALMEDSCLWFLQEKALTPEITAYLKENGVEIRPYDSFYTYVKEISEDKTVLMDESILNYRICSSIPKNVKIVNEANPSELMRSMKNETEMKNTRNAHIKDGVAMCKFMYWLKKNVGTIPMTEISVSDYLAELRAQQEGFLDLSFDTISAYGAHGALCHYSATEESNAKIEPEGFLLVDSGGHYLDGTTDITRTFALGALTEEMKENFTRVCRGMLNLANAKFQYGCTGRNLDYLARSPLWEVNLDYNHGTGHGVGHILNVHEGPQGIRWRMIAGVVEQPLEEGMITSDEPGLYLEGKYGIRTENELLCLKGTKNEYGQFMYFENLTLVPIDLDAIVPEQMSDDEKRRLNAYHAEVFRVISPYLTEEEALWLKEYTREI